MTTYNKYISDLSSQSITKNIYLDNIQAPKSDDNANVITAGNTYFIKN